MTHIAREGETEYVSIHRNRSGESAGCIDYGIRVSAIENLASAEKAELFRTAEAMLERIREYCKTA